MKNNQMGVNMGWDMFERLFLEHYFPMIKRIKMKLEFMEFKRLSLTLFEYKARFTVLFRFAPGIVPPSQRSVTTLSWG